FVISSLAAYLGDLAKDAAQATGTIAAPDGEHALQGIEPYRHVFAGPGGAYTVTNTGKANLYVDFTSRGVPATILDEAVSEGGLTLTRTISSPENTPMNDGVFDQSRSYVVHLTFGTAQDMKNVIVADLLPAGFEIENPRLEADALPALDFSNTVQPTYLDVRDDRLILAFETLGVGQFHFYYVVRAITPGQFSYPPAEAECMYDGAVRARTRSMTMQVK
ncbi:MAG: alpha-2-macroglobulin, partial [Candidatus Hydrogenedentes bacterium]|nr:alpha-2-macroglobulin [Candidatus Hydrogenedentota bacterium]